MNGAGCACEVKARGFVVTACKGVAQAVDFVGGKVLELVDGLAYGAFVLGGNAAEVVHQSRNKALLERYLMRRVSTSAASAAVRPSISARKSAIRCNMLCQSLFLFLVSASCRVVLSLSHVSKPIRRYFNNLRSSNYCAKLQKFCLIAKMKFCYDLRQNTFGCSQAL